MKLFFLLVFTTVALGAGRVDNYYKKPIVTGADQVDAYLSY